MAPLKRSLVEEETPGINIATGASKTDKEDENSPVCNIDVIEGVPGDEFKIVNEIGKADDGIIEAAAKSPATPGISRGATPSTNLVNLSLPLALSISATEDLEVSRSETLISFMSELAEEGNRQEQSIWSARAVSKVGRSKVEHEKSRSKAKSAG